MYSRLMSEPGRSLRGGAHFRQGSFVAKQGLIVKPAARPEEKSDLVRVVWMWVGVELDDRRQVAPVAERRFRQIRRRCGQIRVLALAERIGGISRERQIFTADLGSGAASERHAQTEREKRLNSAVGHWRKRCPAPKRKKCAAAAIRSVHCAGISDKVSTKIPISLLESGAGLPLRNQYSDGATPKAMIVSKEGTSFAARSSQCAGSRAIARATAGPTAGVAAYYPDLAGWSSAYSLSGRAQF